MYYQLAEDIRLVSYKEMPYGIYSGKDRRTNFIPDKELYLMLYRCDGHSDIDTAELSEYGQKIFDEMLRIGIVKQLDEPLEAPVTIPAAFYSNRYRASVHWSITGKCNYNCRHCFQSAPDGVLGEPSYEELVDIIHQMKACGIPAVELTGGEPLIRDDFFEIVDECLRNDIAVSTIYSNGALITQEFLDELKKRVPECAFQLSFDGVGYHDWMRGVPGAEQIAFDAMALLKKNGYRFSTAMCLCKENAGSIKETIMKLTEAGSAGLKIQKTMPQGMWADETEHFLTNEETLEIYEDLIRWYAETPDLLGVQLEGVCALNPPKDGGKTTANILMEMNLTEEKLQTVPCCGVLLSHFFIGPNGAVTPCMSMCGAAIESQFPNLFETPLADILSDSSLISLSAAKCADVVDANEKCHECPDRLNCCGGRCRAMAVGEAGTDYYCADEFTCWFFKSGWYGKIRAAIDECFEKPDDDNKDMPENMEMTC